MTASLRKAMRSTGYYIISTNPKHHEDTAKLFTNKIVQLKHMQNSVQKKKNKQTTKQNINRLLMLKTLVMMNLRRVHLTWNRYHRDGRSESCIFGSKSSDRISFDALWTPYNDRDNEHDDAN